MVLGAGVRWRWRDPTGPLVLGRTGVGDFILMRMRSLRRAFIGGSDVFSFLKITGFCVNQERKQEGYWNSSLLMVS